MANQAALQNKLSQIVVSGQAGFAIQSVNQSPHKPLRCRGDSVNLCVAKSVFMQEFFRIISRRVLELSIALEEGSGRNVSGCFLELGIALEVGWVGG